jgi:sugar transferase (PEP-CTERM/EpsH1 system associated)
VRLLYLATHEPWPLNTGARLRDYHLARELARRAAVTYAGVRNEADRESLAPPADAAFERVVMLTKEPSYSPGKILRGMLGPVPVTVLNFWSENMRRQIESLLREGSFDSVQIEGVHFAPYIDLIRDAASRPALIADWHNIESEVMRRYAEKASIPRKIVARRTAALIERTERQLLHAADICTVVSQRECDEVRNKFAGRSVAVIPNGVDAAAHSEAEIRAVALRFPVSIEGPYLLFVGSMDYHANIDGVEWFVTSVWPALVKRVSGLKLVIVGRDPAPQIQALQSPDVVVTGTVEDVRPYYLRASAVIVPLRVASGTRLKILEAMAAGVPVVSTRMGAEGIEATSGQDILLADTEREIAESVQTLLQNRPLAESIAAAARDLVRTKYDWSLVGEHLLAIHSEMAAHRRSTR